MPDSQIYNGDVGNGLSDYTLPGRSELILKAVNATFTDNGAAGDWLPAVVVLSDSGHVIARCVDQAVRVVGGDGAEVSWFPGVKNSGAGFAGLPETMAFGPVPSSGIPSGVVTSFQWGANEISGGNPTQNSAFHYVANPTFYDLYVSKTDAYWGIVRLEWAASFAGDRYVEIDVASASPMPQRLRVSGTPQGDVMILPVGFVGGFDFDRLVTVNVFQASGADQDIADLHVYLVAAPGGP